MQVTSGQSETLEVTEITDTFDKPCFDITGEIHYDMILCLQHAFCWVGEQDGLKPILLANFVQHVDHMHENRDELFEEEFKVMSSTPVFL